MKFVPDSRQPFENGRNLAAGLESGQTICVMTSYSIPEHPSWIKLFGSIQVDWSGGPLIGSKLSVVNNLRLKSGSCQASNPSSNMLVTGSHNLPAVMLLLLLLLLLQYVSRGLSSSRVLIGGLSSN